MKRITTTILTALLGLGVALPAMAAPSINKGDTAWMFVATLLVILMTIPGLALFYGGLVRAKNMLSVLMQVMMVFALVIVLWCLYGYSLAFTQGNAFIGGFDRAFLQGIWDPVAGKFAMAATFSKETMIPEFIFVAFQGTFAAITCALIVGAFAERAKFAAVLVFVVLWFTFGYLPVAHMVWFWAGPDAITDAASLQTVTAAAGYLWQQGALDFAGGTVVHINSAVAGLVGAYVIGKRIGYGRESMAPHSLPMTMVGASLLWVGWFGFNAGSNLESNSITALAIVNTFVASAAAGVSWMFAEWFVKGKPSLLGLVSGAVAGLVAVTPASGFAGPMGSVVLGLIAGAGCFLAVSFIRNTFKIDDSLDVFGIHGVGGIIGALATGILVNPALGGAGIPDYLSQPGTLQVAEYVFGTAFMAQVKAVCFTIVFSGVGSFILFKLVDLIIGLRVSEEDEREGLDLAEHGERAYNM